MAQYPLLPINMPTDNIKQLYDAIQQWGAILGSELASRDIEIDAAPTTNIYTVVTVGSIGRPRKGDIAYSASAGKFKGYVSLGSETSWKDFF
jgi:hypothetical protein|tara:strand:- start:5167 stop:5442 length:276 start_codon:yes stop_codon:yes gene_type:complete